MELYNPIPGNEAFGNFSKEFTEPYPFDPNLQGTVKGGERVAGTENKYFTVLLTKSLRK
jgi:hypothetical protein